MPAPICEGLNVVELGSGSIAASLAGMVLADNGARVLKVEPPEGDALRDGNPVGLPRLEPRQGERRRATFDRRRSRAGRDLGRAADVVIDGLAPGRSPTSWGLDDESLPAANPGLVYCSIKGFGSTGPYARLKAYEGVVQAKIGVYSRGMFGFRDGPVFAGAPTASVGAAHMAVSGILAALIARETTGRGQRVDTSLVQGMIPADYFGIYHVQLAARAAAAGAGGGPNTAPGDGMAASRYSLCLCTKDGRWINFSPQQPHQAHALLRSLGLEGTLEEERFSHGRSSPPPSTRRNGRTCSGSASAPRRGPSSSRSSSRRTTCRSSCAARARKRSTTRRSSPTVKSSRSTTRCSARCGQ